jgi:hypothetical protein
LADKDPRSDEDHNQSGHGLSDGHRGCGRLALGGELQRLELALVVAAVLATHLSPEVCRISAKEEDGQPRLRVKMKRLRPILATKIARNQP